MFIRTILLALLSSGAAAANLRSGPCDDSFPLAPLTRTVTSNNGRSKRHDRRLVAIPPGDDSGEYYETGEYYAPLCPDGRRIDIRELARCVGDQCYDEDIGFCVYVCTWNTRTPPPTPAPTAKPTFQPEVTEHPLLISLRDLPEQYRMSQEIRAAIVRYMRDKLKYELAQMGLGLELIELSYPGRLPGNPHALPLNVKVKGPSDISSFALSYIMQVMRDSNQEIVTQLKKLDGTGGTAFKDLQLSIETYNVNDISAGATNPPSKPPTPAPSKPLRTKTAVVVMDAEKTTTVPWWVWLIVALVIICLCICCCYCIRHRRRDVDKNDSQKGPEINVFMQNHIPAKHRRRGKPSQQSVAAFKTTNKSQRPPRSIALRASDQSRMTTHTNRTHKTRSSRPVQVPPMAAAPVAVIYPENELEAFDAQTAVSALPAGDDPPEEHALALYNPDPQAHNPTYYTNRAVNPDQVEPEEGKLYRKQLYPNPQARDPTYYTNGTFNPDQVEPEGDKVYRKQSVFASGALMNDVHRERKREEEDRRERATEKRRKKRRDSMGKRAKESFKWSRKNTQLVNDPSEEGFEDDQGYYYNERILPEPEGLTSDEVEVKKKKKRKSKKTKKSDSSRDQKKDNMGGKLKRTLSWKQDMPVNIDFDANGSDDIPSILTRHTDGREEHEHHGGAPSNPYCRNDDGGGHSRSRPETSKEKKGRTAHQERNTGKKKKNSIFAGVTRASSMFVRDGISSDDSFHVESEEEGTGIHRQESHGSYSSAGA
mmetsp:Transcript_12449/g.27052  ORF Transcript_12449/g.27052 Transcript_12449/m.27052 type:complete len:765 (+) Transcript_12449:177-2471(+)